MLQDSSSLPDGADTRQWLREGTAADHARLDSRMGACNLASREGMIRFLRAHATGLAAVAPAAAGFVEQHLHASMPDMAALLAQDLADLDAPSPVAAPALAVAGTPGAAGAAYVLIGSRLGMAMLRARGYWQAGTPGFSRYMDDRQTAALWAPLVGWLRGARLTPAERAEALAAARASFAAFERGLEPEPGLLMQAPHP